MFFYSAVAQTCNFHTDVCASERARRTAKHEPAPHNLPQCSHSLSALWVLIALQTGIKIRNLGVQTFSFDLMCEFENIRGSKFIKVVTIKQ